MKTIVSAIALLFFISTAFAQNVKPVNSGELISEGIKLHDQEKYKEAAAVYRTIPRNDTNYVRSLYELAYTLSSDSSYDEALKICNEGLTKEDSEYELDFLVLRANIVDDIGDSKRALQLYDSALTKYPNYQGLFFNKAIALLHLDKNEEAEEVLKSLLLRNPYYSSAHYRLGNLALAKGQLIPAMMCYYTYLLVAPEGSYSSSSINLLAAISKGSDDALQYVSKRKMTPEGNLGLVEQIVTSKIALDKNYKVLTSLDDPVIRQLQVMMEKLEYEKDNPDFFMQFYVPYIKDIFNKKLFEPAVYTAFSGVTIDKIQDYLKKNSKETTKAAQSINDHFHLIRSTRVLDYSKRISASPIYNFDEGVCFAKGRVEGGNEVGEWDYYHKNGNRKAIGMFINGKKDGKWTYYYDNGKLSGYDNWENGEQVGEDLTYNKKGVLVTKANFVNGKLDGEKTSYYAIGHAYSITAYSNGVESGLYQEFHISGKKKIEASFAEGELNGTYKSFFQNGKTEIIASYNKGKLNGTYQSFYDNGQLEFEAFYKEGKLDSEAKTYHRNGKLKHKLVYVNGTVEGDELDYNDESVLLYKVPFKKGKADGLAEYYDDDGKLYSTFQFENDRLKQAKYFDKSGKLISTSTRQNKLIELSTYNPEGFKTSFVAYDDKGQKQGADTFYYNSGKVKEVNYYADGALTGVVTGYYSNGTKQYEVNYTNDKKNGLTRNYYVNGAIQSEGWYVDGQLNGDWIDYNEKGNITFRGTYLNDELYGTRESYFANGKLDDEEDYQWGWRTALRQFDSLGKTINNSTLKNSSGKYKGVFPNGKPRYEGTLINGDFDGSFTTYFIDGSINFSKNYDHGLLNGPYKEYNYGGQISAEGSYDFGKKTGVWKSYYSDGKISREERYEDGELNGKSIFYFPDGKIEREVSYKNGERNGVYNRYAYDGQLASVFYYKDDVISSYTYKDKNGQLVPAIPVKGGSGKVITYFSNGSKSTEMEFADGKLTGSYKLYYPNGKVYYEEENVICGITYGKTGDYYPNGNVKTAYYLNYDNLDGSYKEYYENGKIKDEANYYNGYLHGPRKFYDSNGKLTLKLDYYYGIILNISK